MNDFLGNKLETGDTVVIIDNSRTSAWFSNATVVGFTKGLVRIQRDRDKAPSLKAPHRIVRVS